MALLSGDITLNYLLYKAEMTGIPSYKSFLEMCNSELFCFHMFNTSKSIGINYVNGVAFPCEGCGKYLSEQVCFVVSSDETISSPYRHEKRLLGIRPRLLSELCCSCVATILIGIDIFWHYEGRIPTEEEYKKVESYTWPNLDYLIKQEKTFQRYQDLMMNRPLWLLVKYYAFKCGILIKTRNTEIIGAMCPPPYAAFLKSRYGVFIELLQEIKDEKTTVANYFNDIAFAPTVSTWPLPSSEKMRITTLARKFLKAPPELFAEVEELPIIEAHTYKITTEDSSIVDSEEKKLDVSKLDEKPGIVKTEEESHITNLFLDIELTDLPKKVGSYTKFYKSLKSWFVLKRFLTEKQLKALEKMHNTLKGSHCNKHFSGKYLIYLK